jgi:Ca-activated chloride channel family protein
MRFEQQLYLWLLLPALVALGGFFLWAWREKKRLIALFISARLLPSLTLGVATERQKARMALLVAAVGLLMLALSRPQIGFSWEEARSQGLDIVVAIDTSKSMLATDLSPNRLRRAQLAALDLKRLAKADRLGLVAFAGSAFLQCPLTLDDEPFRQSVEALDVNIIPQGGTALAEAIQTARSAFKEGNDNHKVLVLFTDGEDHDGEAVETAKEAAKEGMVIFTIGVGTPNGDVLRTTDVQGRTEFIKGPDGNAIRSKLNEKLLEEIAAQTPEGFYRQLSGANTMDLLYTHGLAPLPKSDRAAQQIKRHHERFQWLLGLAIVLLLTEMLVPERKETRKSAAVVAKAAALMFLLLLSASTASAGSAEALEKYESGKYESALLEYERALISKPDDTRLHFNAGTAAFQGSNFIAALQHLNAVLTNSDVKLQQRAYYNLGNTRYRIGEGTKELEGRKKLWDEAVKCYQSAVALQGDDADARYNLQFVQRQVAEVERAIRLREEARKAKENAAKRVALRDYQGALGILQSHVSTNSAAAKEFEDQINRLSEINRIIITPQP